jgi:hypothetical protein
MAYIPHPALGPHMAQKVGMTCLSDFSFNARKSFVLVLLISRGSFAPSPAQTGRGLVNYANYITERPCVFGYALLLLNNMVRIDKTSFDCTSIKGRDVFWRAEYLT